MSSQDVLKVDVVDGDDDASFHVPVAHAPETVQTLLILEGDGHKEKWQKPLEAAEWAVEVATRAPNDKLFDILAGCDIEYTITNDDWVETLKPRLQRELKKQLLNFIELDSLEWRSVTLTPEMTVKATFIVENFGEWERQR